jgi:signal transduction histidine kinase/FixJ family two-component response regulator
MLGNTRLITLHSTLALVYLVLTIWATETFGDNPPVRLANAAALVFLLRSRFSQWPTYLAVAFAAGLAARLYTETQAPVWVALCNTAEILAAAAVIRRGEEIFKPWYDARYMGRILLAWLVVPAITGLVGAGIITSFEFTRAMFDAWLIWYGASAFGLLMVTPLLLTWTEGGIHVRPARALSWKDFIILAAGTGVLVAAVLQEWLALLALLAFPGLLLMTWAFGLAGCTAALVAVATIGGWWTINGDGAISAMASSGNIWVRAQALQFFLTAMVLSSLPFAILLDRQRLLTSDLRKASEARFEFLSVMSHEIRTPLTGVLGMVDLLGLEQLSEKQRRYVDSIRSSGRHLLNVINDILDFSRMETGGLQLEHIDFALPALLEDVQSLVHALAVEKGLALKMELDAATPAVVNGDPTRIKQILLNLLGNGVKFTKQGGVTLTVSSQGDGEGSRFRFEVKDSGVGIAADKLAQLFHPFTQADQTIARQYGGSGLGLAISRRLAIAMGGEITVVTSPGSGSTFTLLVPLGKGDPEPLKLKQRFSYADAARPLRILVAEDVMVNQEIIGTALSQRGHHVVFANDGEEAVSRVANESFHLVFMDIQMPRMDGVEATRRIREMAGPTSKIPIIALTANVMASEQQRYLAAGMNECLMKPIDWQALFDTVNRYANFADPQVPVHASPAAPGQDLSRLTELVATADAAPLIDEAAVQGLRRFATGEKLRKLLDAGLHAADQTVEQMRKPEGHAQIKQLAHKLKGSAGTLGFARVAQLAARIESAADSPPGSADVDQLVEQLQATRLAVQGLGERLTPPFS